MDEPEEIAGEGGSSTTGAGVSTGGGGATWGAGGGETLGFSTATTLGRYTFFTGGGSGLFSSTFTVATVSVAVESTVELSGLDAVEIRLESDAGNFLMDDPITKLNSFFACLNPISTDEPVTCNNKKRTTNNSNVANVPVIIFVLGLRKNCRTFFRFLLLNSEAVRKRCNCVS